MASANVKEFTDGNFDAEVLKADLPVLVDFWAEWCAPCRMLSPTIDALADEFAGKVKIGKLDTDSNRQTSINYNILSIPTVLVFKGGAVVKKFQGLTRKDDLATALRDVVGATE